LGVVNAIGWAGWFLNTWVSNISLIRLMLSVWPLLCCYYKDDYINWVIRSSRQASWWFTAFEIAAAIFSISRLNLDRIMVCPSYTSVILTESNTMPQMTVDDVKVNAKRIILRNSQLPLPAGTHDVIAEHAHIVVEWLQLHSRMVGFGLGSTAPSTGRLGGNVLHAPLQWAFSRDRI